MHHAYDFHVVISVGRLLGVGSQEASSRPPHCIGTLPQKSPCHFVIDQAPPIAIVIKPEGRNTISPFPRQDKPIHHSPSTTPATCIRRPPPRSTTNRNLNRARRTNPRPTNLPDARGDGRRKAATVHVAPPTRRRAPQPAPAGPPTRRHRAIHVLPVSVRRAARDGASEELWGDRAGRPGQGAARGAHHEQMSGCEGTRLFKAGCGVLMSD